MTDLIERLEKAAGDDRSLWMDLSEALFGNVRTNSQARLCIDAAEGSIDAALTLAEEVLPGCFWTIRNPWDDETRCTAVLASGDYRDEAWEAGGEQTIDVLSGLLVSAKAPAPALAILIAILKAKEAGHG